MLPDRENSSFRLETKLTRGDLGKGQIMMSNLKRGQRRLLRPISGSTGLGTMNDLQGLIQGFEPSARRHSLLRRHSRKSGSFQPMLVDTIMQIRNFVEILKIVTVQPEAGNVAQ